MTNQELCVQYQNGDRSAGDMLILQNTEMIHRAAQAFASRYKCLCLTADDYYQEGCLALLRAAKRFRPESGEFTHYARTAVNNAAIDALRSVYPGKEIISSDSEPGTDNAISSERDLSPSVSPVQLSSYHANPEQIYLQKELLQNLYAAMDNLSARENVWIRERYGFEDGNAHPLSEMAREYHLSESWAKRLEDGAIDKMHREMTGR